MPQDVASGRPWLGDEAGQWGLMALPACWGSAVKYTVISAGARKGNWQQNYLPLTSFWAFIKRAPPSLLLLDFLSLLWDEKQSLPERNLLPPSAPARDWIQCVSLAFVGSERGRHHRGQGRVPGSPSLSPTSAPPRRSPQSGAGVWRGPEAAGLATRRLTSLLCGFWLLREPFRLADLSPPPPPPPPPRYLGCPWEEMGEGPSSLLRGGRTPKMAAIEQGWIWPDSPDASAWQDQGRFLVYKMLYWNFCMWWQVLLMLLWATEAEVTY